MYEQKRKNQITSMNPRIRGLSCGHVLAKQSLLVEIDRQLEIQKEKHRIAVQEKRERNTDGGVLPGKRIVAAIDAAGIHCPTCIMHLTRDDDIYTGCSNNPEEMYADNPDFIRVYQGKQAVREINAV